MTSVVVRAAGDTGAVLLDLADLVLGAACPLCGVPALGLCSDCGARIVCAAGDPVLVDTEPVPVWAAARYEGELREAILAWKEAGRHRVRAHLAWLLARAVLAASSESDIVLVPIPRTRRSLRRRGADVLAELVDVTIEVLRRAGVSAHRIEPLELARQPADQSDLDAAQRAANVGGCMRARSVSAGSVVVVDDIFTTGATTREAVRALGIAGIKVAAVAVVAHPSVGLTNRASRGRVDEPHEG